MGSRNEEKNIKKWTDLTSQEKTDCKIMALKGGEVFTEKLSHYSNDVLRNLRSRDWFLTVNIGAECFPIIDELVHNLPVGTKWCYIIHNKQFDHIPTPEESLSNSDYCKQFKEHGNKRAHYHIAIQSQNSISFFHLKRTFVGAHIEMARNMQKVCLYLLHRTKKAISDCKEQYDEKDLFFSGNSIWFDTSYSENENFIDSLILYYVYCCDLTSIASFYNKFGLGIKNSLIIIKDIIYEYQNARKDTKDLFGIVREYYNKIHSEWVARGMSENDLQEIFHFSDDKYYLEPKISFEGWKIIHSLYVWETKTCEVAENNLLELINLFLPSLSEINNSRKLNFNLSEDYKSNKLLKKGEFEEKENGVLNTEIDD